MEELLNKKTAFHIHTGYSYDSFLDPKKIIENLLKNDYEQVVITDHNSIQGALEAKEYSQKQYRGKLQVIIGEEISTDIGDIIGFPIEKEIKQNNHINCMNEIKNQGGFICLPHPYKEHNYLEIHKTNFLKQIDFVEIFNSRLDQYLNEFAERYANYYKKKMIIGSDAHLKNELNNTCFLFKNQIFEIKILEKKYSSIMNIRKSQSIKYFKQREYLKASKYYFLRLCSK